MCSNENWIGILGGVAAATVMLATAYADKHGHAHIQPQAAPAHVSAPAMSGERAAPQTRAPGAP